MGTISAWSRPGRGCWGVQMLAQKMKLPGSVRNNPDGTVTIVIQGTPTDLVKFKAELPNAVPYAQISRLTQKFWA